MTPPCERCGGREYLTDDATGDVTDCPACDPGPEPVCEPERRPEDAGDLDVMLGRKAK